MRAAGGFRLGVTGGIGSGKSTLSALLARRGAALIDADALSRAATAPGGDAIEPIRRMFGAAFIQADGALDRERMRELAFREPDARERLQAIIHPLVGQAIAQACKQARMQGAHLIVHDIPLLSESLHWPARLDAVLVVDCDEATQIQRVGERNQLPEAAVRAIMATQSPRLRRLAVADWVIFNGAGTSLAQLGTKAHGIAGQFGL